MFLPRRGAVLDNRAVPRPIFSSRPPTPHPAPAGDPGRTRVSGPYRGYFIVSSTYPVNDKFAGRAGICAERPRGDGRAQSLEEVSSMGAYDTADKAMQAAEYQARFVIDGLAPNWAPFTAPG